MAQEKDLQYLSQATKLGSLQAIKMLLQVKKYGSIAGSAWTEITQAIRGDVVMVDGTVTTSEIANRTILADNIDQTATGGRFGEIVAAVGTFSVVDTDVLNANSVIAREVQVFPAGGTAPTSKWYYPYRCRY